MQHTKGNEVHFNGKLSRRRRKFWTLKEVNEREKHFPNLISGESRMSFDVCCVKLKPFCVLSHLNSCDVILEKMLMRGLEVGCNFIVFKGHMWCSEWWMFYDYVIIMSQLFPWTIIWPMESDARVSSPAILVQTGQFIWNNWCNSWIKPQPIIIKHK